LLILGGISGAGMTTFVEEYRPIFMAVTIGLLGWAFYVTYRSRIRSHVVTFNKVILWAVTVVAVVLLFFPTVVTDSFAPANRITADMDRTVISIEGMT
jgi:drug/metabolite transporter (DMT)-like permease